MKDKFTPEPTYICIILPEDRIDEIRISWSEMLIENSFDICPFPLTEPDGSCISHWLCLHESTTLDWKKIELFCHKQKMVMNPTDTEFKSFYPMYGESKFYMGMHPDKDILFKESLKAMNLVMAPAKMRRECSSFHEMKNRHRIVRGI